MMHKRKICVITGSRAEYGLLSGLMRLIADSPDCQLQVIATNMHLMPEHGLTYKEIEADGFVIDEKVAMPKLTDDALGVVASMAAELTPMAEAIKRLAPDIAVVLGDRYEMLIAAIDCMMLRVPLAHIHGGEITEGAIDDSIRHCITKIADLHFTSTPEYRHRVIQMGEHPESVHWVGALGVENMKKVRRLTPKELADSLDGFIVDRNTLIATYHPTTLGYLSPEQEIHEFLRALDAFPQYKVLFTMPNSDQGGSHIRQAILDYCQEQPKRCKAVDSLGLRRYVTAVALSGGVVGNSSSGIIEAPSLGIPTVNIGDRQRGRARSASVVDCGPYAYDIKEAIKRITSPEALELAKIAPNPYDEPDTAQAIFNVLASTPLNKLRHKKFYDIR